MKWLAVWCLGLLSCGAWAEVVKSGDELLAHPRVGRYIFARPLMEVSLRQGVAQDKKFGLVPGCQSDYSIQPLGLIVLDPIEFAEDKEHPSKGRWGFRFRLDRCGASKVYNTLFMASADGPPQAYFDLAGLSKVPHHLFKDVFSMAGAAATLALGGGDCNDTVVFDTEPLPPAAGLPAGAWDEKWRFWLCGKLVDVKLRFVPAGKSVKFEVLSSSPVAS